MPRYLLAAIALAGGLLTLHVPASAASGLVDWGVQPRSPSPTEALQLIRANPEWVRVCWRSVGAEDWQGNAGAWDASRSGLAATGEGDGLLNAFLRVCSRDGALRLRLVLTANRAVAGPVEVAVGCAFDPSLWDRQFFPRLPYEVLPPDAPAIYRFASDASDATDFARVPNVLFYPFGVLESADAFILWGCPDVGRYAVVSPNLLPSCVPCFSLRPRALTAGRELTFDFVLKSFAKPHHRYRDVLRWYLRSCESSDPLVSDLFPWDGKFRARRFPPGNLGHGTGRLAEPNTPSEQVLAEMRRRHVGPIWFQGWGPWDETYATEGEWFTEWWQRTSAEKVRDEIAWERENGLSPLMYFRQFLTEQGVHDDRPPLREWLGRDEHGNRMAWGDCQVPEHAAKELGFSVLQQSCADFGNDGYRAWYEERIRACLDFYRPAGIAWDMGWGAGPTWGYSRANPLVHNGDGMLRAQADLWEWIHEKHPDMRTISNEAFGTPSQMFSDGILIEGGLASGKTELDYEAAKALDTSIISFEYPHLFAARVRGLPVTKARFVQMRYRAVGLDTKSDRYVVYPSQEIVGKEGPAIVCSQLIADGQWHVATFDMAGLPNVEEIKGMAFGMDAAEEEAHLWVDWLRFSETVDGPPVDAEPNSFPANITGADAGAFEPRPGWTWNAAAEHSVGSDQGALKFTVRGAGKGMSWSFYPARRSLAQEYLKVVSLGASLGSGLRAEWTTLNAFSAQAMALAPLVGSHDVEVQSAGVTASAWGTEGRLLVAVHNGTHEAQDVAIEVARDALAGAGVSSPRGALSRVMGRNALPSREGPVGEMRTGALRLSVRLEPGEALLWGNWQWE